MKKRICMILLLLAVSLLTGCNMRTIDELYCLPKRSEAYNNLQSQIDKAMAGFEFNAPISGENRLPVQIVDLNGDGENEYLVFAKGSTDAPLRIFIFAGDGKEYVLLDTITASGSAFVQVEYVQMDDRSGMEIVLGCQVSDQVVRSLAVYTMVGGQMEQMMTAGYSRFVCHDLDQDACSEILVLRPGETAVDNGIAELYGIENGIMERSQEVSMSEPSDAIQRIMIGKLDDGLRAVYVASDVDGSAIITDIYAIVDDVLTNVSFSNDSGTSVQTLRNYYVYADDIDEDGVLELPDLITQSVDNGSSNSENQHIIRWYAMDSAGKEINKMYTYHNVVGGWYMRLNDSIAEKIYVTQQGNSYEFFWRDDNSNISYRLMSVYVLTGQKREEQAVIDNRFILHRTESTIYAANLDVASAEFDIYKEDVINSFHLIYTDWYTGEI